MLMKLHLAICPLGVFALDEGGKIVDKQLFDKKTAASRFVQLRDASEAELPHISRSAREGKIIPELKSLYDRVSKKSSDITLEGDQNYGLSLVTEFPNPAGVFLRKNFEKLEKEQNFSFQNLHNLSLDIAEHKLNEELKKPDKLIIQLVNALNEVNENENVLSARFAELNLLRVSEKNRAVIQEFGDVVFTLKKSEKFLENDLARLMKENFPNIAAIAGATIGAKLLSIAGDSERFAKMASSKIQVLGAEKALFRHLTTGAKPPKYGIISTHQAFQGVPKHFEGKVARALAAKISLAAKADVFTKHFIGDKLKKDLEMQIQRMKGWDKK